MKLYTGKGDDGTTGLYYGGRVRKDDPQPEALGAVDEAQAAMGVARAEAEPGGELDRLLGRLERDLYVLMAELATAPDNRHKLTAGSTLVTAAMVRAVETAADNAGARFPPLTDFVVPGQTRVSALLDVARTAVRRAERAALAVAADGSAVIPYLNRLSSLLWALARGQEAEGSGALRAKDVARSSDREPTNRGPGEGL